MSILVALVLVAAACVGRSGFDERRGPAPDACATTVCPWGSRCDDGVCVPFGERIAPVLGNGFADGGVLRYDSGGSDNITRFATRPLAVDTTGRLVLGGSVLVGAYRQVLIARFLPDGSLDTTFGDGGETRVDLGTDARAQGVAADPQDTIYAGVSRAEGSSRGILKLSSAGLPDATWGVGGYASALTNDNIADGMVRRGNGELWLAGHARPSGGDVDLSATMFNANGTVKTSVGVSGTIYSPYPSDEFGSAILEVPGGVVLGGQAFAASGQFDFILVKVATDGLIDTTFGVKGIALHSVTAGRDVVRDMLRLPSGRLVAVGNSEPRGDGADRDFAMAAFTLDGTLDTGFADSGTFVYDHDLGNDGLTRAVVFDDERFIAVGQRTLGGNGNITLAMFTVGGDLVPGFGDAGFFDIDLGSADDAGLDLLPQPDGSLFVVGMTSDGEDSDFAVMHLRFTAGE